MPSALSGQNDYYARHHRRQSSISQSSLPDQLKNSIATAYSPSRSAIFLPATTYGHTSPSRSQSPFFASAGHIASHVQSDASGDPMPNTNDPDEYYRQFQAQHVQSANPTRSQAISHSSAGDITSRHFIITSSASLEEGEFGVGRGQPSPFQALETSKINQGLPIARTRKSSVKHLVAQINASSTAESPPIPKNTISQPASRSISPVMSFSNQPQSAASQSVPHGNAPPSQYGLGLSVDAHGRTTGQSSRKPLFGEVLPDASTTTSSPGFGINQFRHRSGSEGSPLLTEHSQYQKRDMSGMGQREHTAHSAYPFSTQQESLDEDNLGTPTGTKHRRVHSDSPGLSVQHMVDADYVPGPYTGDYFPRPMREESHLSPSSHNLSASSYNIPNASVSDYQRMPKRPEPTTPKRSSPARRRRSPQIQSPGGRRKSETNTATLSNSSLQASIIVPPPKISPPLRSSRPRLPVSSASTASSRARMVEKFNSMQKLHNDKQAATRKPLKPPELSDVDLKARRLRITQALSRSLEGQDLRGTSDVRRRAASSGRTASPAYSDRSRQTDATDIREDVPVVTINMTPSQTFESEHKAEYGTIPASIQTYGDSTSHAPGRLEETMDDDDDSPTLGRGEEGGPARPSPLRTDFLRAHHDGEPLSALTDVTAETEGTTFDPEPQSSTYQPRLGHATHGHAAHLKSNGSINLQPRSSCDDLSDRGDEESVHLVLRDTTYLEDEEAIRTGYRKAPEMTMPIPRIPSSYRAGTDSWASSAGEFQPNEISRMDSSSTAPSDDANEGLRQPPQIALSKDDGANDEAVRKSEVANDTYTIVNIVLQQRSTTGVVDQQFVDYVYQKVLQASPFNGEQLSTNKIEQICLKELHDRDENWRKSIIISGRNATFASEDQLVPNLSSHEFRHQPGFEHGVPLQYSERASMGLSPGMLKSHRYKSSLDSVEDWADTSPSIGDWMRFAIADNARLSTQNQTKSLLRHQMAGSELSLPVLSPQANSTESTLQEGIQEDPELYAGSAPRAPSPSPPVPPAKDTPLTEPKEFRTLSERPQVPQRLASLTQPEQDTAPLDQASAAPSKSSVEDHDGPEHRQLKKRRHIIKELVDTEYSYEKDLKVLCDIYKQTAAVALTEDDIRVLFGNVEQVQEFSEAFLTSLKAVAKPAYTMERTERKKEKASDGAPLRSNSSSSTLASTKAAEVEAPSMERDKETRIGQAFELAFARMEKIYADYIRNRHAANQRLEIIQRSTAAREWLKECRDNSSDITNAWNLDALLVKPVQRITKYPLLLRELADATPQDHPDASSLKRAFLSVTDINIRINDVKKHTELVDQVLNRKRKDSDVRLGLSKAFGRRAEKLKQHLGTAEMYEDNEYNEIKINYDNNIVQLMVVSHDCSSYGRAITKWVNKIIEMAAAGEAWIDVGPSNHQEAESRLRHFAMVARGICTIALPDHLEQLENKVLNPMQSGVDLMNRFKTDQKGLLQKRDKRLIDYAQAKNRKDKGEKVDKKMAERMEQWEALNSEAKQRMKKLIRATAVLVRHCQRNLLEMQMAWLKMVQTKLSNAVGISLDKLDRENIEKEWQIDFDFQEASALSLSICNGALIAEAINMVNLQTPSTTLNGDDSPRQPSFSSAQRRSISIHSNNSHVQLADSLSKNGGSARHGLDVPNERGHHHRSSFSYIHDKVASISAGSLPRTNDHSGRNGTSRYSSANSGFTGPNAGRSDDRNLTSAPRLSVETPSPFIGSLQPEPNHRPQSSSTFVTAAAEVQPDTRHQSNGSSVFSSAMPMPDSPTIDRHAEQVPESPREPEVLFTAASVYEFNIDRSRREAGFPYLTYVTGEIFDIIGYNGELWLAKNQDDPHRQVGWIWNKHFAKLAN